MYPLDYQRTLDRRIRTRLEELSEEDPPEEAARLRTALECLRSDDIGCCSACSMEIAYWHLVVAPGSTLCEACEKRNGRNKPN